MKNHIINGHYMFGNTFMQPEMPMYNRIAHHNMAPVNRPMPPYPDMENRPVQCHGKPGCTLSYEECANKVDAPYNDSSYNSENCKDCILSNSEIIRDPLMYNVVNIETAIIKTLRVTIYGTSAVQDKTIDMQTGKRYAITYITEHGLIMSVGRLEVIGDSVPDTCTRYINTNNLAAASSAYIGLDCSSEGRSDKRKIYIATIRYIQELADGEVAENVITEKTTKQRIDELLNNLEKIKLVSRLGELLDQVEDEEFKKRIEELLNDFEDDEEIEERVEELLKELDSFQITEIE